MKICYLILAHNNFLHLNRLIEALNDNDAVFYIHVDKKAKKPDISSHQNVHILPDSVNINWGGFSMVEATLKLMEYASTNSPDADYFILISGVDYPIRGKGFLYNLLSQGKEYIDIAPVPVPYKPLERYEYYYFDYDRRNLNRTNLYFLIEVLLKKLKIKRKAPFKIYAGTQWFALTRECISYILEVVKKDNSYINFFKHTLVSDEAFFQTIIGNSPFNGRTASSLTYTDWTVPEPPALINEHHIVFLQKHMEFNDEYGQRFPYFARKFNDESLNILESIRQKLW